MTVRWLTLSLSIILCAYSKVLLPHETIAKSSSTNKCDQSNGHCPFSQHCIASNSSVRCLCDLGFIESKETCLDIDECKVNKGGCEHKCINQPGFYQCVCKAGYKTDIGDKNCVDINECYKDNGKCHHFCSNTQGWWQCYCSAGFTLVNNTRCVRGLSRQARTLLWMSMASFTVSTCSCVVVAIWVKLDYDRNYKPKLKPEVKEEPKYIYNTADNRSQATDYSQATTQDEDRPTQQKQGIMGKLPAFFKKSKVALVHHNKEETELQ